MSSFNQIETIKGYVWKVLPTVFDDALSYTEQVGKIIKAVNELVINNNEMPEYIKTQIENFISGGAIGEVVKNILSGYILNVKYPPEGVKPATGDGTSDDTAAVQGCIDYAAKNGYGVVYFPYGKYLVNGLTLKSNVSLMGYDRYSTTLVLKGGADSAMLNGDVVNSVGVYRLNIDGNSGVQVNDVDLINITGSNVELNDLLLGDAFRCLVFNGVGGHLQVSNVVCSNTVKKCFEISGSSIVKVDNVIFTQLSAVGGENVVEINSDYGSYEFTSTAECSVCLKLSGNDNKIDAIIKNAVTPITLTGEHNNIKIHGDIKIENFGGKVVTNYGVYSQNVDGEKVINVGSITETVSGNRTVSNKGNVTVTNKSGVDVSNDNGYSETNKGNVVVIDEKTRTHTVKGDNVITEENKYTRTTYGDVEVEEKKTLKHTTSGDVTRNIGGNLTKSVTGDKVSKSNNYTEQFDTGRLDGKELVLDIFNGITYKKPEKLNKWFNKIPAKDTDGNMYDILVAGSDIDDMGGGLFVSPKKYGAVGDGVTDDTEAFRRCFAENDFIVIDGGEFLVKDAVDIRSNMRIIGNGTIYAPNEEQYVLKGVNVENVAISGITFKDGVRTRSDIVDLYSDIYIERGRNIHISDIKCSTSNKVSVILLDQTSYFTVQNCKLHDTGYCAIECYGRCYYGLIDGNEINVGTYTGYVNTYGIALSCTGRGDEGGAKKANECKNIIISNNILTTDLGYWEGIDTHSGDSIFITGNRVIGFYAGIICTRGNNVETTYPTNIFISNNYVKGSANIHESRESSFGIRVAGSQVPVYSNINISGNTVTDISSPSRKGDAINVDNLYGCVIKDNVINYASYTAIAIDRVGRATIKDNIGNGNGYTFLHVNRLVGDAYVSFINNYQDNGRNMYAFDSFDNINFFIRKNNSYANGYWIDDSPYPKDLTNFVPDMVDASPAGSNYKPQKGSTAYHLRPVTGDPVGWVFNGTDWLGFGAVL